MKELFEDLYTHGKQDPGFKQVRKLLFCICFAYSKKGSDAVATQEIQSWLQAADPSAASDYAQFKANPTAQVL